MKGSLCFNVVAKASVTIETGPNADEAHVAAADGSEANPVVGGQPGFLFIAARPSSDQSAITIASIDQNRVISLCWSRVHTMLMLPENCTDKRRDGESS